MDFSMACYLLIQLGNISHNISTPVNARYEKERVRNYQEVLEILETFCVEWKKTNIIQNSLWERALPF